jgi:hypothetical protein
VICKKASGNRGLFRVVDPMELMMMRTVLIALCGAALASCASVAAAPLEPAAAKAEAIYAVSAGKDAVRFRVSSTGCTKKPDFVIVRNKGAVLLKRVTLDRCQSFVQGSVWLEFSYGELGVAARSDFQLANPLAAWTGPGE